MSSMCDLQANYPESAFGIISELMLTLLHWMLVHHCWDNSDGYFHLKATLYLLSFTRDNCL